MTYAQELYKKFKRLQHTPGVFDPFGCLAARENLTRSQLSIAMRGKKRTAAIEAKKKASEERTARQKAFIEDQIAKEYAKVKRETEAYLEWIEDRKRQGIGVIEE